VISRLRLWFGLLGLAAVAIVASMPFFTRLLGSTLAAQKAPVQLPLPAILALFAGQTLVLAAGAAALGVWAAPRTGLDAPLLRARLSGERVGARFIALLPVAVGAGTLSAVGLFLLSQAMKTRLPADLGAFPPMSPWVMATSAFYGGIIEELLTRWGLLALFAWVLDRMGVGRGVGFWVANVAAALAFGLLHLPAALQLGVPRTPLVFGYLLVANAVVALVCGWLFRRSGLESAMVAHGTADLWLHVVFPALGL
jgi:hypothetical protein